MPADKAHVSSDYLLLRSSAAPAKGEALMSQSLCFFHFFLHLPPRFIRSLPSWVSAFYFLAFQLPNSATHILQVVFKLRHSPPSPACFLPVRAQQRHRPLPALLLPWCFHSFLPKEGLTQYFASLAHIYKLPLATHYIFSSWLSRLSLSRPASACTRHQQEHHTSPP